MQYNITCIVQYNINILRQLSDIFLTPLIVSINFSLTAGRPLQFFMDQIQKRNLITYSHNNVYN